MRNHQFWLASLCHFLKRINNNCQQLSLSISKTLNLLSCKSHNSMSCELPTSLMVICVQVQIQNRLATLQEARAKPQRVHKGDAPFSHILYFTVPPSYLAPTCGIWVYALVLFHRAVKRKNQHCHCQKERMHRKPGTSVITQTVCTTQRLFIIQPGKVIGWSVYSLLWSD